MNKLILVAVLLCGFVDLAVAQNAAPPNGPWSGAVSFGYLASTGNSEDTTTTGAFKVAYAIDAWKHAFSGAANGASTDNSTTTENYQLAWKSTYDFTEFNYGFGALNWNKDRFSGYPEQTFATVGYGRRILNSERFVWNAEIGAGYSKQRVTISDTEEEDQDGAVGVASTDFTWTISDNASFEQLLSVYYTSDNTRTESTSSLKAGLIGNVRLVLSYFVKNNSDVAPDLKKTDTTTSISLEYEF